MTKKINNSSKKEFDQDPTDSTTEGNGQASEDSSTTRKSTPINPFDPAKLRMSQDFAANLSVKKVLTTMPCRKPNRQEWVRCRGGEDWRLETVVFDDKVQRETYLVEPQIMPELLGEVVPVCLFLAITRQGDPFFWQVKLPGEDGRTNTWNESALESAQLASKQWTRVSANMAAGCYDTFVTDADLPEPVWPELTMAELLEICFRDRFIRDADHPTVKRLRGEL